MIKILAKGAAFNHNFFIVHVGLKPAVLVAALIKACDEIAIAFNEAVPGHQVFEIRLILIAAKTIANLPKAISELHTPVERRAGQGSRTTPVLS